MAICEDLDAANSFLTKRNDGARTFLNKCDCYLQGLREGAGTFFPTRLIRQKLFCEKLNDWAGTYFAQKFAQKIDGAGTFSCLPVANCKYDIKMPVGAIILPVVKIKTPVENKKRQLPVASCQLQM